MTRDEHLAWAKQRALKYVDAGDLTNAVGSMAMDLEMHEELGMNAYLVMVAMLYVQDGDSAAVRRWIEGFR